MAYTYHISFDNGSSYIEFYPSNYPKVTFTEYPDEMFLRPVIEEIKIGRLLNVAVYDALHTMFFNNSYFATELKFLVKRDGVTEYPFCSSVSNAKIDTDRKLFRISPEPDDACQDILNYYSKKTVETKILASLVNIYYWSGPANVFVNVDLDTFTDINNVVTWTFSGGSAKYARLSWAGLAPSVGDQVRILLSSVTGAVSLRLVNGAFAAVSNAELTENGLITLTTTAIGAAYIEILVLPGGDVSGTFTYQAWAHNLYKQGHELQSYIDAFLTKLGISNTVKSTHLFGDALPSVAPASIDAFMTACAGYDYVTEEPAIFDDNLAIISLDWDNTTDMSLTFNDLMNIIKVKLRCWWYIDSDGFLRIEHQKYFRSWPVQLDLTSATYAKYKPEVDAKEYNYDKSEIYNQTELSETEAVGEDFLKTDIIYNMVKTAPKSQTVSPPNLITDVQSLLSTEDDRSILFLCSYDLIGAKRVITFEPGVIDDAVYVQNIYLSWAYQLTKYWSYFGEADVADINDGTTLTLEHVKEILLQVGIKFYHNAAMAYYQPVTLANGTGWLKKIEHDLNSGFFTIDVGFSPTEGEAGEITVTADSTTVTVDSTLITVDTI